MCHGWVAYIQDMHAQKISLQEIFPLSPSVLCCLLPCHNFCHLSPFSLRYFHINFHFSSFVFFFFLVHLWSLFSVSLDELGIISLNQHVLFVQFQLK